MLLEAVDFAARKHRDQRRKDEHQTPYINHPIGVAYLLWKEGGVTDIAVLQVSLLHKLLKTSKRDITLHFPYYFLLVFVMLGIRKVSCTFCLYYKLRNFQAPIRLQYVVHDNSIIFHTVQLLTTPTGTRQICRTFLVGDTRRGWTRH